MSVIVLCGHKPDCQRMVSEIKLGSLFDGSGGFPLAGSLYGITPAWASEVEPYPIAVTRTRFPNTKHLGDIAKINGWGIEPVDIITFGSPCQDLSIAGLQAGLKHKSKGDETTTRSGLFMEAVRIIKEMRDATNGMYPRYVVWENVFGAFGSNKGRDFQTVIEEFIKIKESEAPSVAAESTLSQILEEHAPQKYYLSKMACEGILRRAERRGKKLPPMLKEALEQVILKSA